MVDRKGIVVCNGIKERKTDDDKRIRESSSLKDTYKISFSFSGLHKRPGLSKEREVFHLPDSRLTRHYWQCIKKRRKVRIARQKIERVIKERQTR